VGRAQHRRHERGKSKAEVGNWGPSAAFLLVHLKLKISKNYCMHSNYHGIGLVTNYFIIIKFNMCTIMLPFILSDF